MRSPAGLSAGPTASCSGPSSAHASGPPEYLEDPASSRFAQACGLAFSLVGLLGFALGAQWLALGAIGLALGAAFLNAAFDFCIGCEIYLRAQRLRRS